MTRVEPDSQPTVDVIICAKNEARRIGACIESLIAQDYPADLVRIYVADNGSTDSTAEIVRQYPVQLIEERKKGAAAARNSAFRGSTGTLVAFLDAHCIANPEWISSMVGELVDERVGGVQGCIENTASNPRVLEFLVGRGMTDNDGVLEDTVYGSHNIYPWILSGNCMYRRSVISKAGGFDETLPACEDVDLAWKVVLAGYLLAGCERATVVHWNDDDWATFAKKSWRQGRGSAVLAKRYLPHGARNAFEPAMIWGNGKDRSLIALRYWAGYRYETARISAGRSTASMQSPPSIERETRRAFSWTGSENLSISTDVVYWFRGDSTSAVVHHPTRSRIVLDGTANFIWRRIASGSSRDSVTVDLANEYMIDKHEAEADLDEFVDELLKIGLLHFSHAVS